MTFEKYKSTAKEKKTKMNYKCFTITIHNPDTMDKLDRLALSEHRTRSAQIEYIIEKYMEGRDE